MDESVVERNRAQQAQWYGEPVGDTVRRVLAALGSTQGQLAGVLGLSAPMLSQLASGQRAKIGNPAVLARLSALAALADDPELETLSRSELARRVEAVRSVEAATASTGTTARGPESVQAVLRAVASAAELDAAARALDDAAPGLAEVLRVYGLGRTQDAREHWARHVVGG